MGIHGLRYRERNGRFVERVIEVRDHRNAFKIAQRYRVNSVWMSEGGVLPKDGEPQVSLYGLARFQSPTTSRGGGDLWGYCLAANGRCNALRAEAGMVTVSAGSGF